MTDIDIDIVLNHILDMFHVDVDPFSALFGKFLLIGRDTGQEINLYNDEFPLTAVMFKDKYDFIDSIGTITTFSSRLKAVKNPFYGCKNLEEIMIKLDLIQDEMNYEL